jgi:hypothetical protein
MMRPWLQLAITFAIALSLVAAPCKNCQPKPQAETKDCGHDCCPKPKPQQTESCGWQPAAYDAVETKSDISIDTPAVLPARVLVELPVSESHALRQPAANPPRISRSITPLRI